MDYLAVAKSAIVSAKLFLRSSISIFSLMFLPLISLCFFNAIAFNDRLLALTLLLFFTWNTGVKRISIP